MTDKDQGLTAKLPTGWIAVLLLLLLPIPVVAQTKPELIISGNASDAVAANIRALINLEGYACQPPKAQYGLIRRQILNNGDNALKAMGYYESQLSLSANTDGECAIVTLQVQTGPPVLLTHADIRLHGDAAEDPVFQRLVDEDALHIGERLQHDRYTRLKRNLQQSLINRGYVEGKLTRHELTVDTEKRSATIVLIVDSGPRYRFGQVEVSGSELDPDLIQSYVQFEQGQPFDSKRVLETQQAYLGAGYFSAARIQKGTADPQAHTIPVSITLSDNHRWSLLTGIGFSTDTGPRVRLGIENRRVNRQGHRFRAETQLSEVEQGAGASYQIPLSDPLRERLDLHSSYVNEDTDSNTNERWMTGADYIVELKSKWVSTLSLEYLRETWQIADEVDQAELVMPGYQLSRIKANDPVYPTFGWRLNGKIRVAHQGLSSTASFVQLTPSAKLVFPLVGGRVLTRLDLGYTEINDVTELPASMRFFAGGDSSIRGFSYESLGPEDANGEVIGGRHMATGSLEYDHPLTEKWHLAVFSDAGNAFNDVEDYELRHSAGVGIRWRSPLGPIRLDVARAVDENRDWRIHLSMGPDL
ncbi:MAG: autotransporter assembly complex family protein [Pseudomonadota bacterium]|uniref:autotransporter assembly complex protein TamA n=1 Tax=Alcanivorax sp. TaxID=1872427 RepID=UPI0025C3A64F|nr:autotransporter assembly complex family protein [Alcanivorax sp.]MEE3320612.1 autotransporter assembly complex family protein [Pseudomonadota bacterium]